MQLSFSLAEHFSGFSYARLSSVLISASYLLIYLSSSTRKQDLGIGYTDLELSFSKPFQQIILGNITYIHPHNAHMHIQKLCIYLSSILEIMSLYQYYQI